MTIKKSKTSSAKTAKKTTKKVAKKAVKKAVTKTSKTPVKKTTKKSSTKKDQKELVTATGAQAFWARNGFIMRDLLELRDALSMMDAEVYAHHVTKNRNDFADWVDSVLHDAVCATDLRAAKKPATAHKVVIKHLKLYRI